MSKNQCACHCGGRVSKPRGNKGKRGGRKFISGHNQFRRESLERNTYRGRRKPPAVKVFEGRMPSRIRPREIHNEL